MTTVAGSGGLPAGEMIQAGQTVERMTKDGQGPKDRDQEPGKQFGAVYAHRLNRYINRENVNKCSGPNSLIICHPWPSVKR